MKIIYVHHALRDNGGTQDDGLLPLGVKDAKNISKIFKMAGEKWIKIKAIYTSPYYRCKKTAEIINKNLNVEIIEDSRFNEFDSKTENWIALQKRVQEALKDLVDKYEKDECVIVVTSGVNIAGFINLAYKLEASDKAPFLWVPSCSPIIFNIGKEHFENI